MSSNKLSFFEWVAQCCHVLGWPVLQGQDMMPDVDPCWYNAYDDGLTPEQAVLEYKTQTNKDLEQMLSTN